MTFTFYMVGGHKIVAKHVNNFKAEYSRSTGKYTQYTIEWENGRQPAFFSLCVCDIVAIVAR